jgi:ABC transport system ATP-binding/permease protein
MLDGWPGTLVVVSHDRAFLERTVEDVIVLDGRGHAGKVPGGYAAYESHWRASRRRGRATEVAGVGVGTAFGSGTGAAGQEARAGVEGRAPRGGQTPGGGTRRTPSTLRHLLRRAETEMHRLQDRQAALEAELAGAGSDHVALAGAGEELSLVNAELTAAEERWLALAEEAESLGLTT